jgi:hypothetical protein
VLPGSFDVKLKVGLVLFVSSDGRDVIVVFGGRRSMVQLKLAGVGSVFPAVSVARTRNVWLPLDSRE